MFIGTLRDHNKIIKHTMNLIQNPTGGKAARQLSIVSQPVNPQAPLSMDAGQRRANAFLEAILM